MELIWRKLRKVESEDNRSEVNSCWKHASFCLIFMDDLVYGISQPISMCF